MQVSPVLNSDDHSSDAAAAHGQRHWQALGVVRTTGPLDGHPDRPLEIEVHEAKTVLRYRGGRLSRAFKLIQPERDVASGGCHLWQVIRRTDARLTAEAP